MAGGISRGHPEAVTLLAWAHEVVKTGDRGMREKRQWRGAGYGCSVPVSSSSLSSSPFQCRRTFEPEEAGYST
jgi:hypothetical protein